MQTDKQIINAHRLEAVIGANNSLTIEALPFDEGKEVEVIVLEKSAVETSRQQPQMITGEDAEKNNNLFPYHGMSYRYDDPFEPAAPLEDWEVYK